MKNQKNVVFTDRSDNSINILFKDIRKYPLLKDDEEKELLDRLSKGNMKAQGYALHDIAQKHKLTEEKVKSLIKDINHFLTTH